MTLDYLIDALRFRLFWLKYGSVILRRSDFKPRKVKVGRTRVKLSVPPAETAVMDYELQDILYRDCYGLEGVDGAVDRILDIGGNIGLFSLAARSRFPQARIHSYEPNPQVHAHLLHNTHGLAIQVFPEAIGAGEGWVAMNIQHTSLLATTRAAADGPIKKTALATAIDRIGGSVDLLKLDCEGAEWELFECRELWKHIRRLTMEYHLWADPEMNILKAVKIIKDLGFRFTGLNESPQHEWGILHAVRI